jgi:hypothetical protein
MNATKRRDLETIGDVENEWSVASKRNKTQKTQAVSGVVSRRKPKHFLEAKAREPPRGVAKLGQPATPMPNFLQTQASMHESKR